MNQEKEKNRDHRFDRINSITARSWDNPVGRKAIMLPSNKVMDCGWGRLIFAHTFQNADFLAKTIRQEKNGQRDIAMYVRDPHVLVAKAPQEIFLDPSDTYRLWLANHRPLTGRPQGFAVRRIRSQADAEAISHVCSACHMVPAPPEFIWQRRSSKELTYVVAQDVDSGEIIGTATGVDHVKSFADPENGSSLWCLAVRPQARHPGLGKALVNFMVQHFQARGRAFVDLSVLHDNQEAISLYKKLGFSRIPAFSVKHKNPINEPLFIGPSITDELNPYAMIIVNEARRRGIGVEVDDAENGFFRLRYGGRSIRCRESLSELTSAIGMSRCDDKQVTSRILERAGLRVPEQVVAGSVSDNRAFVEKHRKVVVKPAQGEQGRDVYVKLTNFPEVEEAVNTIRNNGAAKVVLEEYCEGEDLRIIVINYEVVAAAVRKPAQVVGNGEHTIQELIDKQSRRRAASTGGESTIPVDEETKRCISQAGYTLTDILPAQKILQVRNTANLHTGGTIHDVTAQLHPALAAAAVAAARALDIPVVGLDFMVGSVNRPDYVVIEANERPGLANHEPQPTAERFVDLLFPESAI